MRRAKGTRTAAALLTVGLLCTTATACGTSDDSGDGETKSTAKASTGADGGAAFPVQVKHSRGTTEVSSAPKRVVALTTMDLDAALSMGVTPVGAGKDPFAPKGISPWLTDELDPAATELFSTTPDVSYEKVAALDPDLILATGDYAIGDHYTQLSKIAPTVAPQKSAAEDSWQTREKQIGSALGRSEDAERQIGVAEAAISASATRHSGLKGKTFSASFGYSPTQIATLASPKDFAVKFLEALGPKVTPSLAGTEKTATKVQPGILSPEQAEKLSADLVVIGFNSPQVRKALEANPAFTEVKKSGTYQAVNSETITLLRNPSILGIPWLLKELDPALAKAAE
ncbi:ABC transporter substrate-binding protein [Streptomyces sp. SID4919]|uniref:ABC transporter substrate-binding protein n=1 Tax=unclassified Streptomyces TaxID=2593676 RepID=UPI000823B1F4|nr:MULTISPECIES: ABC transporter substrate-binding protein [unclassified Streptomyces]MYY07959.1 ABC transporter substrate-binding protein [Streptomyces sp. SID4919]SCK07434.1 iron complex transport system substrate-binding protein [Streptomyces sp. AmelKG-E11A]